MLRLNASLASCGVSRLYCLRLYPIQEWDPSLTTSRGDSSSDTFQKKGAAVLIAVTVAETMICFSCFLALVAGKEWRREKLGSGGLLRFLSSTQQRQQSRQI